MSKGQAGEAARVTGSGCSPGLAQQDPGADRAIGKRNDEGQSTLDRVPCPCVVCPSIKALGDSLAQCGGDFIQDLLNARAHSLEGDNGEQHNQTNDQSVFGQVLTFLPA